MEYKGSCLCGSVQFKVVGDISKFFLCHCEYCRKDTGSAHAANIFFTNVSLKWIKGAEKVTKYNYNNTRHNKSFCSTCGSALPRDNSDGIVVPAGSLDCDIEKIPDAHIFMKSKGNWDVDLEKVPKFDKRPS